MSFFRNGKIASIISCFLVIMFAFVCYAMYLNLTPELQAQVDGQGSLPDYYGWDPFRWDPPEEDNNCGEHHDCGCSACDLAYR